MHGVPGWGAKIPHIVRPKKQNIKQKNTVTNSIKNLKIFHIKKYNWHWEDPEGSGGEGGGTGGSGWGIHVNPWLIHVNA